MDAAETKFSFMSNSPAILPHEVTRLADRPVPFSEQAALGSLCEYVKSNTASFLVQAPNADRVLLGIARQLNPASMQLIKLALSQAYDKLQAANLDQLTMMSVLAQVAKTAILSQTVTLGNALPDAAIETIISATLSHN